jgi:hypothetical protein
MAGYIIYVKLPGKRFAPTGDGCLVTNLIHADIFTVNTPEDKARLDRQVTAIETHNPGFKAELRLQKDW